MLNHQSYRFAIEFQNSSIQKWRRKKCYPNGISITKMCGEKKENFPKKKTKSKRKKSKLIKFIAHHSLKSYEFNNK